MHTGAAMKQNVSFDRWYFEISGSFENPTFRVQYDVSNGSCLELDRMAAKAVRNLLNDFLERPDLPVVTYTESGKEK